MMFDLVFVLSFKSDALLQPLSFKLGTHSCVFSSDHENFVTVGKITFNLKDVIGRGCEGTVVYRFVFSFSL